MRKERKLLALKTLKPLDILSLLQSVNGMGEVGQL